MLSIKAYKTCYYCNDTKHISNFYSNSNLCKVCYNSIATIHRDLKKKFCSKLYVHGYQDICFICNERHKRLDLANIDHNYSRNLKDYMLLCSSCHTLLDSILENRNNCK